MDYFLTTRRLGFRRWRSTDESLAFELWGDPSVTRLIDARTPLSRAQTRQMMLDHLGCQEAHGIQYWPLFRLEDHAFVGCCGLRPHDAAKKIPELGFHICSRFWKNGFARESAAAVVQYAFSVLDYPALYAGHHPENHPSARILSSLGFAVTGAEVYPPTGLMHPACILQKETYLRIQSTKE